MKFLISGPGGTGKRALEAIQRPIDLFDHLMTRGFLSLDNIIVLQGLIWRLGKKDLQKQFVEFGRKMENRLYFYTPKDEPENGYKYVKFHIMGSINRSKMEHLRSEIARLLCVPNDFIIISGLEKSNSTIITLMIPEDCVIILWSLQDAEKTRLLAVGVDCISYENQTLKLSQEFTKDPENVEDKIFTNTLERMRNMEKELDICHAEVISYKNNEYTYSTEIKRKKEELILCKSEIISANRMAKKYYVEVKRKTEELERLRKSEEQERFSLLMQSARYMYLMNLSKEISNLMTNPALTEALEFSKELLHEAEARKYDKELIDALLETNGVIQGGVLGNMLTIHIQQMLFDVCAAMGRNVLLEYQNDRLKFLHQKGQESDYDAKEFEQYVMMRYGPVTQRIVVAESLVLDVSTVYKILGDLSKQLTLEERNILLKDIHWDVSEQSIIDNDKDRILELMAIRAMNAMKTKDIGGFHNEVFSKINRPDLIETFERNIRSVNETKQREAAAKQGDQLSSINERLENIEKILKNAAQMPLGTFQSMPFVSSDFIKGWLPKEGSIYL